MHIASIDHHVQFGATNKQPGEKKALSSQSKGTQRRSDIDIQYRVAGGGVALHCQEVPLRATVIMNVLG